MVHKSMVQIRVRQRIDLLLTSALQAGLKASYLELHMSQRNEEINVFYVASNSATLVKMASRPNHLKC